MGVFEGETVMIPLADVSHVLITTEGFEIVMDNPSSGLTVKVTGEEAEAFRKDWMAYHEPLICKSEMPEIDFTNIHIEGGKVFQSEEGKLYTDSIQAKADKLVINFVHAENKKLKELLCQVRLMAVTSSVEQNAKIRELITETLSSL